MKLLSALLCLSIVVLVTADVGFYTPKAFYTINENGQKSPLVFINGVPSALHRLRRSAQYGSSSSASVSSVSSSSSNGGNPAFFSQTSTLNAQGPIGALPFPIITPFGIAPQQFNGAGSGSLDSRFGEDEPVKVVGTTQTVHSNGNGYTVTTTHQSGNGPVNYNVQSGKF